MYTMIVQILIVKYLVLYAQQKRQIRQILEHVPRSENMFSDLKFCHFCWEKNTRYFVKQIHTHVEQMIGYTLVILLNFSKVQILNFLNFTKTSSRELVLQNDALNEISLFRISRHNYFLLRLKYVGDELLQLLNYVVLNYSIIFPVEESRLLLHICMKLGPINL
jgi:hypothetical protein